MSHDGQRNSAQAGELVFEGRVAMACPLERAALRDARLSWAARGLFAFLWDLPERWRPCLAHLATMGRDGVYSTRSALAELEAVGAIRIEKMRSSAGQLAGQRWVVISATQWASEAPLRQPAAPVKAQQGGPADAPGCNFPSMDKSDSRETRASGNRTLRVSKYKVLQTEGSPTTTTPRARGAADVDKSDVVVVSEEEQAKLIWPGLSEDQLTSVRGILLGNDWPGPANAQALLDELAGQLAVPGKVRNPSGLLRRMLERQRDGRFTMEFGLEVRQIREARRKQQEREAAALAGQDNGIKTSAAPAAAEGSGTSAAAMQAREDLSKLRQSFGQLRRPGPSATGLLLAPTPAAWRAGVPVGPSED